VRQARPSRTRFAAQALGHAFRSAELLERALSHSSAGGREFDRLEFLGDRVLALIVARRLFETFPGDDEGALSRRHHDLVRRETLAEVAEGIGLMDVLASPGVESRGPARATVLADAMESLIAAVYLDGGMEAAEACIQRLWGGRIAAADQPRQDAKTRLQEWAQGRGLPLPAYAVERGTGPDHAPAFRATVIVAGLPPAAGEGSSKRLAERAAAAALLALVAQGSAA